MPVGRSGDLTEQRCHRTLRLTGQLYVFYREVNLSFLNYVTAPPLTTLSYIGRHLRSHRDSQVFVVSGSPRGGTTWLAESLGAVLNTQRLYWEPLQDGNIALPRSLMSSKRPFFEPDELLKPHEERFFRNLLTGKQANAHLLRLRTRPSNLFALFGSGPLLIKFVRGNGILGYLHKRFNINKPLVIIRHPCAVVASQLRMGRWEDHPHVNQRVVDRHSELAMVISDDKPLHARLAMTWAADVLSAKAQAGHVHIIYYEHLVKLGVNALIPVLDDWGVAHDGITEALGVPSSTTHHWSSLHSAEDKLGRWRKDLSSRVVNEILQTVEAMGITEYGTEVFPYFRICKQQISSI